MTTEAKTKDEIIVGSWTTYHDLDANDKKVFDEALKGFVGVKYSPFAVSKQVVAGINYRFKCKATMPPSNVIWEAIVDIYAPPSGTPYITGIHRI